MLSINDDDDDDNIDNYKLEVRRLRDENQLLMKQVKQQEVTQKEIIQRLNILEIKKEQNEISLPTDIKSSKINIKTKSCMKLRATKRLNCNNFN